MSNYHSVCEKNDFFAIVISGHQTKEESQFNISFYVFGPTHKYRPSLFFFVFCFLTLHSFILNFFLYKDKQECNICSQSNLATILGPHLASLKDCNPSPSSTIIRKFKYMYTIYRYVSPYFHSSCIELQHTYTRYFRSRICCRCDHSLKYLRCYYTESSS